MYTIVSSIFRNLLPWRCASHLNLYLMKSRDVIDCNFLCLISFRFHMETFSFSIISRLWKPSPQQCPAVSRPVSSAICFAELQGWDVALSIRHGNPLSLTLRESMILPPLFAGSQPQCSLGRVANLVLEADFCTAYNSERLVSSACDEKLRMALG